MKPAVAVIMPVFNGARFVAVALDSVLRQTRPPSAIIVVDDGSTDNSAATIAACGPQITFVAQANAGAGTARNNAVKLTGADYLAFLDQDDLWLEDKLALQLAAFARDPTLDMVFGHAQQFFSPDWTDERRRDLYCPAAPVPGYIPSALLIKRDSFLRVGFFGAEWRLGGWADWYARAVDSKLRALMLPEVVVRRRLHERNQGLVASAYQREYPRLLKAMLDRRRCAGQGEVYPL